MRKLLRTLLFVLILAFIVLQFFQPEKNQGEATENDFFAQVDNVPSEIEERLLYCCYDCHSNYTKYPWYGKIAPMSFMLNNHVITGKEELNFSEWGTLSKRKQIGTFHDICDAISDKSMPLKSYLKMHRDAELSDEQIDMICDWVETETETILSE